jgi:hypothetical protein
MAYTTVKSTYCWICGRDVPLVDCTIDECGRAVHEECYVARMKVQSESQSSSGMALKSA